jgi:hypothetical protein
MTGIIKFITTVYSTLDSSQFVSIRIKQFSGGLIQFLDRNDYFQPEAILDKRAIWIYRKFKKPAKFIVLYDRHKHNDRSNKCPYMILRVGKDHKLEDMTIEQLLLMVDCITK